MRLAHRSLAIAGSIALLVALGGCASKGEGGSAAKTTEKTTAKAAAKPADVAPPAGTKLAKVKVGMTDVDVRKAIGEPDTSKDYMTGKAWIPFYFGPDAARTDWIYKRQGRVVFSRNRYSGGLKVIHVTYNPAEPGA